MNTKQWAACVVVAVLAGGCSGKDKDKDKGKPGERSGSPTVPGGLGDSLTALGAGPGAMDATGLAKLPDAAARRKAISDLIRRGADMTAKDKETGWTAMHWAAADGDAELIEQLRTMRADVDATDAAGKTPLHEACRSGQLAAVQALLAARANPRLADLQGLTPLHYAVQSGNRAIVDVLLSRRVDVNAVTKAGQTPLHMAQAGGGQGEIIELLRTHGAAPVTSPEGGPSATQPASMPS